MPCHRRRTIVLRPRRVTSAVKVRTTRLPEIDVSPSSYTSALALRETSSTRPVKARTAS